LGFLPSKEQLCSLTADDKLGATLAASELPKHGVAPMSLTDITIRKVKSGTKPIKLFDERRLYLEVSPAGGKWRRLKYRFGATEKRLFDNGESPVEKKWRHTRPWRGGGTPAWVDGRSGHRHRHSIAVRIIV
jgi:hypothetical protein